MTPRQLRRAAERKTQKQQGKAANGFVFSPEDAFASAIAESAVEPLNTPLEPPEPPLHTPNELPQRILHPPPSLMPSSPLTAPTRNSPPARKLPKAKPRHP